MYLLRGRVVGAGSNSSLKQYTMSIVCCECSGRIAKLASSASCFLLVFWTLFPPRTLDVAFSYNRATRVQRTRIIIGHVHIRILKLTKLVKYAVVCENITAGLLLQGGLVFFWTHNYHGFQKLNSFADIWPSHSSTFAITIALFSYLSYALLVRFQPSAQESNPDCTTVPIPRQCAI